MKFPCDVCGYVFGRSYNLSRHKLVCKQPDEKKEIYSCNGCGKTYSIEKNFLKHKDNCSFIQLDVLHHKIDKLSSDVSEIKERKSVINQTTIINNNNNKYVQNNMILYGMEPLDLSQQRFDELVDKNYTYPVYTTYGIVKDVFLSFFSNEEGKMCVMLSDRDRMKLKCIDKEKGIIYHDPKSMVGMCGSSTPLKEKTKEYQEQLTTNLYGEPNTVNIEDALKRKDVIKDEKIIKRLMSQSSEKFLKKEISPELLKNDE